MLSFMRLLRGISYTVLTIMIYLAIPLIGWGILNWGEFFSNSARIVYAISITIMSLFVGYQAIENPDGFRSGKRVERKRSHRQSVVSLFMIGLLYFALFFLPFADRRNIDVMNLGTSSQWIGLGKCTALMSQFRKIII
jgi:hypothetical protein